MRFDANKDLRSDEYELCATPARESKLGPCSRVLVSSDEQN